MRIVCFLVLLASTVCGNLLATGVKLPTNLHGTAAGQRVVDIYKGLVGRNIGFIFRKPCGDFVRCTGTIEAVVLPNIRDSVTNTSEDEGFYAASGLRLEIGSMQSEDPQVEEWGAPKLIEARNSDLNVRGFHLATITEFSPGILGEKIHWVRVLAEHRDGDSRIAEVLVEIQSDGDVHTEIEPFIENLPMSALPHPGMFLQIPFVYFGERYHQGALEGNVREEGIFLDGHKDPS